MVSSIEFPHRSEQNTLYSPLLNSPVRKSLALLCGEFFSKSTALEILAIAFRMVDSPVAWSGATQITEGAFVVGAGVGMQIGVGVGMVVYLNTQALEDVP